jgi:hypothetical protein
MGDILVVEELEIAVSGVAKGLLLALVNRLHRRDDIDSGAGLHLDKDEGVAVTADQVDLAARRFVIAGQDLVTVPAQESRRDPFTIIPDFRRRQQRR